MKYLYFALVLILIIFVILNLEKLRRKSTSMLDDILYVKNNPALYLDLLDNRKLKLLYSNNTIEHFKLNAYLLMKDNNKIENSFEYLDNVKFTKGEAIEYNMKKLSYYSLCDNSYKAKEALDFLDKNIKDENLRDECHLIYSVYVLKDIKLIKELEIQASRQKGQVKGISLFRIAKLYYYDHNLNKAKDYLSEALKYLNKTAYKQQIIDCLNDLKMLDNY